MPGFHIITDPLRCTDAARRGEGPPGRQAYLTPPNNVETARRHRFLFELMGINGRQIFGTDNSMLIYAYKSTRPSPEIDEITIHNGQDETYRPGKHRWKPIDVTFYEVLGERDFNFGDVLRGRERDLVAHYLYEWWANTTLNLSTSSHRPPEAYLANGLLTMLDGFGQVVWEYHLIHCWPVKVTPSDIDFSDSSIADITVTIRFQKAIEVQPRLSRESR